MSQPSASPILLRQIAELLTSAKTLALAGHIHTDGDSMGSTGGLGLIMTELGKQVHPVLLEEPPSKYRFLKDLGQFESELPKEPFDLALFLDSDNSNRLGKASGLINLATYTASLDHHPSHKRFCDHCYVDPKASAVGEIVFDLVQLMGASISREAATMLLAAIMTDTGNFCFSNTTAKALAVASELLRLGADHTLLVNELYYRVPLTSLALAGRALSRVSRMEEFDLVWSWLDQRDFDETGADMGQTEGIINDLRSTNCAIAALLVEQPEGDTRISLRSNGCCDTGLICRELGGGGHAVAAGCAVPGGKGEAFKILLEAIARQAKGAQSAEG